MIKKKIPIRKCTGCLQMKEKKELIRVVKTNEGEYKLDLTGKMSGRGAYICKNEECLQKAFKSKGLERSFKCAIPKDIYEKIRNELILNEK